MESEGTAETWPCPFVRPQEDRAGSESKFEIAATEMALTPGLTGSAA